LFEDLLSLGRSPKLVNAISGGRTVANTRNKRHGVRSRRGDGTLGELIPGETPITDSKYVVKRGPVATIEIGAEVKIAAKAMIKQVGRVISDMTDQAAHFRRSGNPICVGIVGVNWAQYAIGFEGDRTHRTDGRSHAHPNEEAAEIERRLREEVAPLYNELVVLRFKATNDPDGPRPYPFEWVNETETTRDYGACLTRISIEYEKRF
jgi:hypothetical protein